MDSLLYGLADSNISEYIKFRAKTDPEVTLEFIKKVNKLQDSFLIESFNKGALVCYGD